MERAVIFREARSDPPVVPKELESNFPVETKIILQLLSHDPMLRPRASQLRCYSCFSTNIKMKTLRRNLTEKDDIISSQKETIAKLEAMLREDHKHNEEEEVSIEASTIHNDS